MKKILVLVFISLLAGNIFGEELSDKAQVSLLTCGSGKELYAQFGHTAIRVEDPALNIDVVFNYGMFNFHTQGFYLKFVKGLTDYQLGLDFAIDFFMRYHDDNIPVWEQKLNLTKEQKQQIFNALMVNYEPQNRFYRYNFVYDNCATRPRDMIESVFTDKITYPKRKVKDTFRELIGQYTGEDSWTKFGIDFVVGASADVVATPRERMFLPAELMAYLQGARQADGQPVVAEKTVAVDVPYTKDLKPTITPVLACFIAMIAVFLITYFWKNKSLLWLDVVLFSATGLMGVIVFYLVNFSVHPLVHPNYNLLWVQPLDLLFVLLLPFKKLYKILSYYQLLNAVAIVVALAGFIFLPQHFNIAFLPLMLLLLIRAIHFIRLQEVFSQTK
ncbi:MAG: DUF4105 domain-containing protein [Paludibacteraceae bacterium]|nr:DUF4105 domain-containing protein [Paludibacteraceae bacterium]